MPIILALLLSGTLDDALAAAKAQHRFVLVLVGEPDREAGLEAGLDTSDFVVVRADPADARLRVLVTPTAILLRDDGSEIDRIEGIANTEALRALAKAGDPVANLKKRIAASRDAGERARLTVELARKRLVRGDAGALSDIERVITGDPDPTSGAAEEALFVLASYLLRVEHDEGAEQVWRELAMRFPDGKHATVAAQEYAAALRARKQDAIAERFLARRQTK